MRKRTLMYQYEHHALQSGCFTCCILAKVEKAVSSISLLWYSVINDSFYSQGMLMWYSRVVSVTTMLFFYVSSKHWVFIVHTCYNHVTTSCHTWYNLLQLFPWLHLRMDIRHDIVKRKVEGFSFTISLRVHKWVSFPQATVHCYLEFKLRYLKTRNCFQIE